MSLNKKLLSLLAALCAASSIGCVGPLVEVPTAHVGKVMTSSGLQKGVKKPSTFRLPANPFGSNPTELVLAEASDQQMVEGMTLFMPKDRLNLAFDVRGTYSIASEEERVNRIFARLTPKPRDEHTSIIDFDEVYSIYGQQVVWTTSRAILVKYDIEYVMSHRAEISQELETEIRARLKDTPLSVVNFGLSKVQPPDLILEAQTAAKERKVAIDTAKADRLVKLTEANASLEVARKQQLVDLLEADTQRQVGLKLTKGVNQAFVHQRVLGILEVLSTGRDRIVVLPEAALTNPALMMAVNKTALDQSTTTVADDASK